MKDHHWLLTWSLQCLILSHVVDLRVFAVGFAVMSIACIATAAFAWLYRGVLS